MWFSHHYFTPPIPSGLFPLVDPDLSTHKPCLQHSAFGICSGSGMSRLAVSEPDTAAISHVSCPYPSNNRLTSPHLFLSSSYLNFRETMCNTAGTPVAMPTLKLEGENPPYSPKI